MKIQWISNLEFSVFSESNKKDSCRRKNGNVEEIEILRSSKGIVDIKHSNGLTSFNISKDSFIIIG